MQLSGKPITDKSVAERTNEYTKSYAAAVVELGKELQVPVVDLWTSMQTQPDWQTDLLCDGLHLTPAGNSFVYEQLQPVIDKAYPHLRYAHYGFCKCAAHHTMHYTICMLHVLVCAACAAQKYTSLFVYEISGINAEAAHWHTC